MIPHAIDDHVLILEDNELIAQQLKQNLEHQGYIPFLCDNVKSALQIMHFIEVQLVIIDLKQSKQTQKILDFIKARHNKTSVILMQTNKHDEKKDKRFYATCYRNR